MGKYINTDIYKFINEDNHNLNDNFWKWFGDSKVVDKDGNPLVVFHGTDTTFKMFDINKMRNGWLSKGFYFTVDKSEAKHYGNNILSVYLRLKNPFIIQPDIINSDGTVEFAKSAKEQILDTYPELKDVDFKNVTDFLTKKGYDGIIHSNNLITVFNPNQIKSINNDGSWDLNDDNINS